MKKYGILLIGCGFIGCEHLADIYYRPEFEIIAVADKAEAAVAPAAAAPTAPAAAAPSAPAAEK